MDNKMPHAKVGLDR